MTNREALLELLACAIGGVVPVVLMIGVLLAGTAALDYHALCGTPRYRRIEYVLPVRPVVCWVMEPRHE